LRANYAGEASNVDHWYGQVLAKIKSLDLYDNSIIVFLADHGALLNEQGQWVKGPEKLRKQVTHVPLLVHLPKNQYAGKRVSGFAQTADVLPTVLGRLNLKAPARVTGEDLWPYITGEKTNPREYIVSSYGYIASVRTPEWNYSAVWDKSRYQGNYQPQLYDLKNDPNELKSVADQHPQVLKDLQSKLDEYLNSGRDITNGTFSAEIS
jgi:arylsulfatase A-like enzyme